MSQTAQKSISVGMVCPYSMRWPGGVQHHALDLARALRVHNVHVDVFAPTDETRRSAPAWTPPQDIRVVSLGNSIGISANGSVARLALGPRACARVRKYLSEYDLVHIHEPFTPGVGLAALTGARVPVIGTFHAAAQSHAGYRFGRPFLQRYWDRMVARIVVSDEAAALVCRYFGDDVTVLGNGVDVSRFQKAVPLPVEELSGGPAVFFLGRDEPRKGLDVLLSAFASVQEQLPAAVLWLAGPGTDVVQAGRLPPGTRTFGVVDDDLLARLFASAGVYCSPARSGESFGIVLLEAMAAGTPVVASALPGYGAVARDKREALLVPPDDPASLAEALVTILRDKDLSEQLVAAGRQRVEEFDWEVLSGRIADLYRSCL